MLHEPRGLVLVAVDRVAAPERDVLRRLAREELLARLGQRLERDFQACTRVSWNRKRATVAGGRAGRVETVEDLRALACDVRAASPPGRRAGGSDGRDAVRAPREILPTFSPAIILSSFCVRFRCRSNNYRRRFVRRKGGIDFGGAHHVIHVRHGARNDLIFIEEIARRVRDLLMALSRCSGFGRSVLW